MTAYRIGEFAKSKAGHDKGEIFVILNIEGEYVYLSDGRHRPVEKLKKKKIKHIQIINCIDDELQCKIEKNIVLHNEDIKRAIKSYKKSHENLGGC